MTGIMLIESDGKIFVRCNRNGQILASENADDLVKEIEEGYNELHKRDYQFSMSACIHYITFKPKVCSVKDLEEIKTKIVTDPPKKFLISNVSGSEYGYECRPEAKSYWENAISPKLISEEKEG